MQKLLSLLMGLKDGVSQVEMRKQYQRVIQTLFAAEGECAAEHAGRFKTARERISVAYEKNKKQLQDPDYAPPQGEGLLLGEILIDAQVITRLQLKDALTAQKASKLPLGRILVACKLISWEQLAYYLKMQDLLQLSPTHPERLSRQLLELGLTTKAEMEIAELDCETTGCSMVHAIARRGWLKPALLAALTASPEQGVKPAEKEQGAASPAAAMAVAV